MGSHHHEEDHNLSPQEKQYRDLMKQAQDFVKIDLFLTAKKYYKLAIELKPDDTEALEKLVMCEETIKKDTVKVLITVPIVAGIIIALFAILGFPS